MKVAIDTASSMSWNYQCLNFFFSLKMCKTFWGKEEVFLNMDIYQSKLYPTLRMDVT